MKTQYLTDGEGVEVAANEVFRFSCCDCGLAHDVVIATHSRSKTVGFAVRRHIRATAARRRSAQIRRRIDAMAEGARAREVAEL